MRGVVWRIVVASLFAAALCLVTRTASAMQAPYCDDRAATLMAPPPTLLASETALRRAPTAPSWFCDSAGAASTTTPEVAPGHGQHQAPSPQADPAVPACAAALAEPTGEPITSPAHAAPSTDGVHFRIDRPPRS
jgi:hypothetical protein